MKEKQKPTEKNLLKDNQAKMPDIRQPGDKAVEKLPPVVVRKRGDNIYFVK